MIVTIVPEDRYVEILDSEGEVVETIYLRDHSLVIQKVD